MTFTFREFSIGGDFLLLGIFRELVVFRRGMFEGRNSFPLGLFFRESKGFSNKFQDKEA